MKQFVLFFSIVILFHLQIEAQVLDTVWSRSYGGSDNDIPYMVIPTSDNGNLIVGNTASSDGDVSGQQGNTDFWLVKIDEQGDTLWTKTLGGTGSETATAVRQTADNGFVISGFSNSNDGDVPGNMGGYDYWIVKIDQNGTISWSQNFGGSNDDFAYDVQQTTDLGYIVTGITKSNDGDVVYNHGSGTNDIWTLKLNTTGDTVWTRSYGGSNNEYGYSIQQTSFGNYIIGGSASSTNGDVHGLRGASDYWVVHTDSQGDTLWTRTYGGTDNENIQYVTQTPDLGFLAVGYTLSDDDDVFGHQGMQDYWIVKINSSGDTTWTKTYGGTDIDVAYAALYTIDTINSNLENYYLFNGTSAYGAITNFPLSGIQQEMFVLMNANAFKLTSNQQDLFKMGGDDSRGGMNVQFRSNNKIRVIHNNGSANKTWSTFSVALHENEENAWGFTNKLNDKIGLYKDGLKIDEDYYINYDSICFDAGGSQIDCSSPDVDSVFYGTLANDIVGYIASKNPIDNFFDGTISSFLLFNVVPDSAEIALISAYNDSIPEKYLNASNDSINSGSLIIGQQYQILKSTGGADFTSAGAPDNLKGTVFIATGTDVTWGTGALYAEGVIMYMGKQKTSDLWTDNLGDHDVLMRGGTVLINAYDHMNYIVAGASKSNNGDVFGNHGDSDAWLIKLDNEGDTLLTVCFGGTATEGARSIIAKPENGLMLTGASNSDDGDVHSNHGGTDFWVLRVGNFPTCRPPSDLTTLNIDLFSADLSWTEAGTATQWELMYGETGFDTTGAMIYPVDGNPFTLTMLNQATSYEWYIRAACSASDHSEWSGPASFTTLFPEVPGILWSNSYGGSMEDVAHRITQTSDLGFILAGYSTSDNDDVPENKGKEDYWVLKLNADGDTMWSKTYGGSEDDVAYDVIETFDGGYFVTGYSWSVDGDVHGNHGNYDYWALKLDENGDTLWTKAYGGVFTEKCYQAVQTMDSGFIFAGYTVDNSFADTSLHRESRDYWILKTDKEGDSVWSKILGGNSADYAHSVDETHDGGYIVAGFTKSKNFDVHGNHGSYDMWVIRFNDVGDTLWTRCYGGSDREEAYSIQQTMDEGFVIAGATASNDKQVHGNNGGYDFWVVKADSNGDTLWTRTYGGSGDDKAYEIHQTADSGYLVTGYTDSNDGYVSGNNGLSDYWVIRLNQYGDTLWTKTFGGSGSDSAFSIHENFDGSLVVAGASNSTDGDITGNHGEYDYWVFKNEPPVMPPAYQDIELNNGWNIFSLYVTPDNLDMLDILAGIIDSGYLVKVIDESGGFIQFIPGLGWFNTIGNLSLTEGYYIKVNSSCEIKTMGQLALTPFTIPLNTGWNIMGYPLTEPQNALDAYQDLRDNSELIKVIDESGGFVQEIPGLGWLNTIGNLEPDEGYYIKVNSVTDLTLQYPTPVASPAMMTATRTHSNEDPSKINPYMPMNIIVYDVSGMDASEGDEIAVYDEDLLLGKATFIRSEKGLLASIVVSMDDPTTEIRDGFTEGNQISLQYVKRGSSEYTAFNPELVFGDEVYSPLGTSVMSASLTVTGVIETPESGSSLSCYPNPVNNELTIAWTIQEGDMEIEIYNIQGNLIEKLQSGYRDSGSDKLIYQTNQLPKGMYLIKLKTVSKESSSTMFSKFLKL